MKQNGPLKRIYQRPRLPGDGATPVGQPSKLGKARVTITVRGKLTASQASS